MFSKNICARKLIQTATLPPLHTQNILYQQEQKQSWMNYFIICSILIKAAAAFCFVEEWEYSLAKSPTHAYKTNLKTMYGDR